MHLNIFTRLSYLMLLLCAHLNHDRKQKFSLNVTLILLETSDKLKPETLAVPLVSSTQTMSSSDGC